MGDWATSSSFFVIELFTRFLPLAAGGSTSGFNHVICGCITTRIAQQNIFEMYIPSQMFYINLVFVTYFTRRPVPRCRLLVGKRRLVTACRSRFRGQAFRGS